MKTVQLSSWVDFRNYVDSFDASNRSLRKSGARGFSTPLFRGHSSSAWSLDTTLERHGKRNYSIQAYQRATRSAHRYLGNFGTNKWTLEDRELKEFTDILEGYPNIEFAAYLRHHGFPSPLLDWTASPYVAAFFAFSDVPKIGISDVAIYLYQEYQGGGKFFSDKEGYIATFGPWSSVHERHVQQQSQYSICYKKAEGTLVFCPHEEAITASENLGHTKQDFLVKLLVPTTERFAALQDLFRMNVTPYSLFRSEDSLVRTVGIKLFDDIE